MISVQALEKERIDEFLQYLTTHLAENGLNGNMLFQPLSNQQSMLDDGWKSKLIDGLNKEYHQSGWRKIWVATTEENKIVGHIDIRSRNQQNAEHRVLLGMGVDSHFRKLKIGEKLLEFIIHFCRNNQQICWIDLDVLSHNTPALHLYEKLHFKHLSTVEDMFRIDGISYDYTTMTLYVEN